MLSIIVSSDLTFDGLSLHFIKNVIISNTTFIFSCDHCLFNESV